MQIELGNSNGLTNDETTAVKAAANGCKNMETLEQVEAELKAWFKGWLVYRGGSHVALHRTPGDSRRALLVTE